MNSEPKIFFFLGTLAVISVCGTIVFCFLWFSLTGYHEIIAITTVVIVISSIVIWRLVETRGKLIEQAMRLERYRYREEIPLDGNGEPMYLPGDAQQNWNRLGTHQRDYEQF